MRPIWRLLNGLTINNEILINEGPLKEFLIKKGGIMFKIIKNRIHIAFIVIAISICGFNIFFFCHSALCNDKIPVVSVDVEKPLYAGYPIVFDERGKIDRIAEDVLIVDDTSFTLTKNVTYNTPYNTHAQKNRFHVGDLIGLKLNSRGQVVSVWLIHGL